MKKRRNKKAEYQSVIFDLANAKNEYDRNLFRYLYKVTAGNFKVSKRICNWIKAYYIDRKEVEHILEAYKTKKFYCESCKASRREKDKLEKALRTETDFLLRL